jgi:hypothetical protein
VSRRTAIGIGVLVAMSACMNPSTDNANLVLQRMAAGLGDISSGNLSMRFEMSVKDRKSGGFELEGPFSLRSDGRYPIVEFEHTRFDGDEEARVGTFVSTGDAAYVVRDGKSDRVGDEQLASTGLADLVRPAEDGRDAEGPATGDTGTETGLGQLNIDGWIEDDPEISGGGLVGGVDTDKVTAELDPAELMNGLVQLGQALGGGVAAQLRPLGRADRERVRRAATEAKLETWSGKDDRLLRKLIIEIGFGLKNEDLVEKLPQLADARIRLEAAITALNEPVDVEAPGADE